MTLYHRKRQSVLAWPVSDLMETAAKNTADLPQELRKGYDNGRLAFCRAGVAIDGTDIAAPGEYLVMNAEGNFHPYLSKALAEDFVTADDDVKFGPATVTVDGVELPVIKPFEPVTMEFAYDGEFDQAAFQAFLDALPPPPQFSVPLNAEVFENIREAGGDEMVKDFHGLLNTLRPILYAGQPDYRELLLQLVGSICLCESLLEVRDNLRILQAKAGFDFGEWRDLDELWANLALSDVTTLAGTPLKDELDEERELEEALAHA